MLLAAMFIFCYNLQKSHRNCLIFYYLFFLLHFTPNLDYTISVDISPNIIITLLDIYDLYHIVTLYIAASSLDSSTKSNYVVKVVSFYIF